MNTTEFAAALSWNVKSLSGRLNALDLLVTCSRCGGSGRYSYCQMYGDRCFGCNGSGKGLPRLSARLVKVVQEEVAAGGLDAYLALCKAKAEARAQIKPLVAAAKQAYDVIGQAYEVEYQRRYRNSLSLDQQIPMDTTVCAAQGLNNSLFYGDSVHGVSIRDAANKLRIGILSITEVESALKYNEIDTLVAVAIIRERVVQLETLRDGFVAFTGPVAQVA